MKKRKTIREIAEELYEDEEVLAAVLADAEKNGTTKRIESGELVLPHPLDAAVWHTRLTGREQKTQRERDMEARLLALEQLFAELKDGGPSLTPERKKVIDERTAALEGKVS